MAYSCSNHPSSPGGRSGDGALGDDGLGASPDAVLSPAAVQNIERLDGVGSGERAGEAARLAGRAKDALAQAGLSSEVISDGELLAIAEEVSRYSPAPVLPGFDASDDGFADGDVTRAKSKQVAVARIVSRVEYQNRADMIDLVNAAVFARLHHGMNTGHVADQRGDGDDGNRLPFAGNPVHLAGVNAPAIAQAAITDYAILADITTGKALDTLTAAIDLPARLPHTFRRVVQGRLPAKQAIKLARDTVPLSMDAVGWVDRRVGISGAPCGRVVNRSRLVVAANDLFPNFDEHYEPEPVGGAPQPSVEVFPSLVGNGFSELVINAPTCSVDALHAAIQATAKHLGAVGDTRPYAERLAAACEVLADPHHAVQVWDAALSGDTPSITPRAPRHITIDLVVPVDMAAACSVGDGQVIARRQLDFLLADAGIGALEGSSVTIRPVIDVGAAKASESYTPSASIRERVELRDKTCVFPGCTVKASRCDLDHIQPFRDDLPPAQQTTVANLACLCRRHHRAKTSKHWSYEVAETPPDQRGGSIGDTRRVGYTWRNRAGVVILRRMDGSHVVLRRVHSEPEYEPARGPAGDPTQLIDVPKPEYPRAAPRLGNTDRNRIARAMRNETDPPGP